MKKNISFFGSYKTSPNEQEYKIAYETAFKLAKTGYTIINGGGEGIMAASSIGASDAGGKSIGILITQMHKNKPEQSFNTKLFFSDNLFDRLKKLINNSLGFIIFCGGTGTLAELTMTWELMNKGLFPTFPIVCYGNFWKPIINLLKDEPSYYKGMSTDFIKFAYSTEEILNFFI